MKTEILVYIVEDDKSVQQALDFLLQSAGFQVQTFSSAAEFFECEIQIDNSCIILDMWMSVLSGLDILKKLASKKVKPHVIAISANDDMHMIKSAKELGAEAFLRKPVDDQALIDTIRWVVTGKPTVVEGTT